jgi:hypothetical protein
MTSAGISTVTAGMNIADRIEHGSFDLDVETGLDILAIAGSLAMVTGSVASLSRRGGDAALRLTKDVSRDATKSKAIGKLIKSKDILLITEGIEQSAEMANAIIVSSFSMINILRIKEQVKAPELRKRLIAYELMKLDGSGLLVAVSLKQMKGDLKSRKARIAADYKFAPYGQSGFSMRLQRSIIESLGEGDFIGVRSIPKLTNVSGGFLPSKPSSVKKNIKFPAGIRYDLDTKKLFVSDLDLAFYSKNGKSYSNSDSVVLGDKINYKYNKKKSRAVVQHGDNYNGELLGYKGAMRVAEENEVIYIYNKNGFVESGKYQDMVKKYIRQGAKGGWKVGDPITNLTRKGNVPKWSTVRQRFWKNEALNNPSKYTPSNLGRMRKGLAPQRINPKTGKIESMELHHTPPMRDGGLFDFKKVWPDEHEIIDSFRHTGH